MNCSNYKNLISLYIDNELSLFERQSLTAHLVECNDCRSVLSESRGLGASLKAVALSPAQAARVPAEATIEALKLESRFRKQELRRNEERRLNLRVILISRTFAITASLILFLVTVGSILRPANRALSIALAAAQTISPTEKGNDAELAELRELLLPPPPGPRPILSPRGTLIGFSKEVPEEEFAVIARVDIDGTASVKDVIEAPQRPEVIGRLSNALISQANFKPAYRRGRFTAATVILMFSQVTISG